MLGMVLFGVGVALGTALTGGAWMWGLWRQTGNPIFPFMNGVFRSPWYDPVNYFDDRFVPKNLTDGVLFIFRSAIGERPGVEVGYNDIRLAAALVFLPLLVCKRPQGWAAALFIFFLSGLMVWLKIFGIQRYALVLDMLSGVVMVLIVSMVFHYALQLVVLLVLATACLLTLSVPEWGHMECAPHANGNWFQVAVPDSLRRDHQLFLMLTTNPMSYVIPLFPPDSTFVRVQDNLSPSPATLLARQRDTAIQNHQGPVLSLSPAWPNAPQIKLLANYGFHISGGCVPVTSRIESLLACPLAR
jgi:hypothetical protein